MKNKINFTIDVEVIHFLQLYSKAIAAEGEKGNMSATVEKMLRKEKDRLTQRGKIVATAVTLYEAYPNLKAENLTAEMVSTIQEKMNEKYKELDYLIIGIQEDGQLRRKD